MVQYTVPGQWMNCTNYIEALVYGLGCGIEHLK